MERVLQQHMITELLKGKGFKVGMYTSPFLGGIWRKDSNKWRKYTKGSFSKTYNKNKGCSR